MTFEPVRDRVRSPPLSAYPAPLEAQAERYLAVIADPPAGAPVSAEELFSEDGRVAVRPTTVLQRRSGVRRLLWGTREAGIPLERLSTLAALTEPDIVKAALSWHFARKGAVTSDLAGFGATVMSVASHLHVGAERYAALKALVARIKLPPPQGLTPRNAALLATLDRRDRRDRLVALPATLLARAEAMLASGQNASSARRADAAWLAGVAVAIDLALYTALRIGELSHLRLGQEVVLGEAGPRPRAEIRTSPEASKTGRASIIPLEGCPVRRLQRYVEIFRPGLPHSASAWLFPGRETADQPRHKSALGRAMTDAIHENVGIRMNPHAFRCFSAALLLERDPHAIDDVRAILGHASFGTALAFYRSFETRGAARRLARALEQPRRPAAMPRPPPTREESPDGDRAAWARAQAPSASPWDDSGRAVGLRAATRRNHTRAHGAWLAWLRAEGELEPDLAALDRVTLPRVTRFVGHMQALGRRNSTMRQVLLNLRSYLALVSPTRPPAFLTHPGGRPLARVFPDRPRPAPHADSRALLARAQALHAGALASRPGLGAATRLRDAAFMAILHAHAPRVGDLAGMYLGVHLRQGAEGGWELGFPPETTKGKRRLSCRLAPARVPLLGDYLAHGRPRFPGSATTGALWLRRTGGPLSAQGVAQLVQRRHCDWLSTPHGPHMARKWLTRAARAHGAAAAFDAAAMLGHSPQVALHHYASAIERDAHARHARHVAALQARAERRVARPDAIGPPPLPFRLSDEGTSS